VCPVSVLSNWESQLAEHTDGTLSLCVHHGASRGQHKAADLAKHDIVLTTYGVLTSDQTLLKKVRVPRC
jgi:SWI/SNF-related matrix-associated actin-dependent regulator of chromatin subfamily A3